jgi:hypothetical protein
MKQDYAALIFLERKGNVESAGRILTVEALAQECRSQELRNV